MNKLILVILLFFTTNIVSAKHIIGGMMAYEYLGVGSQANSNKYKFSLFVYRDCYGGGAQFDNPAEITIYEEINGSFIMIFTGGQFLSKSENVQVVPMPCMTPPDVCVQKAEYYFEMDLPVTGNSYHISYQRCCRNETIFNIQSPGDVGATYTIELTNAAMLAKNSSPQFNSVPPIVICNDFPIAYDHSATDKDGDQLIYSFCAPLNGGGKILSGAGANSCDGVIPIPGCPPPFEPVKFIPPYGLATPMGGSPLVNINAGNGFIDGIPHQIGQYVVAVCVSEYRAGQLMSVVRREFQFNVTDCQPDIFADVKKDTVIGFKNFLINACGSNDIQFTNLSIGGSNINSYYWEFDLNNGSFATSTAKDALLTFPDTGRYEGKMVLNRGTPCNDSVNIAINVFPSITADFSYVYDTCIAGPVQFTDHSHSEGILQDWSWKFGEGGSDKAKHPAYLYKDPGEYPVTLTVEDANKCTDDTTNFIVWQPAPSDVIIAPSTFNGCIPANIFFDNLSTPIDSTYTFEWDFGDGKVDSVLSPTHLFEEEGLYSITVRITSPIGCVAEDAFPNWIRVLPSPQAIFSYSPNEINSFNSAIQFSDESIDAVRWFWNFDSLATTQVQHPSYTFQDTGRHVVYLRVVHPSGCVDTASTIIDVIPEITFFMPNAFTPNEDTKNDIFLGKGLLEGISDFKMTIWNRWGEQIFESNDPDVGWNGRKNNEGRPSPPGVYVYVVSYVGPRGESQKIRGFATLIR